MISIALIKRWIKIINRSSNTAVRQGIGKNYNKKEIAGYYNDLTCKVNNETLLDNNGIPLSLITKNEKVYFPICIFQYALGLWDLYIIDKKSNKKDHFLKICDWIVKNQRSDGSWDCFGPIGYTELSKSSMGQGEALSVLIRAYVLTKDNKWLIAANKAKTNMMKKINDGGTLLINNKDVIFEEYASIKSDKKSVLNGWIFSLFGLYDYILITNDKEVINVFNSSVDTIARNLPEYDNGYWSLYDRSGRISSPAYHDLHICLLKVLYDLTDKSELLFYARKWEKYQKNKTNKIRAILIKTIQKIKDKPEGIVIK